MAKECYDHLGNRYSSISKMCKEYKIDTYTFSHRIKKGKTLEEALTGKLERFRGEIEDHLGKKHATIIEMCKAYNINPNRYYDGIKKEMTLEEILTGKIPRIGLISIGNKQLTVKEFAKQYKIDKTTISKKIRQGKTAAEIIDESVKIKLKRKCVDNKGEVFESVKQMCKHYNIEYDTYLSRIRMTNWNQIDALLIPVLKQRIVLNHMGIDGKQYYRIKTPEKIYYLNCEQIIEYTNKGIFERKQDDKNVTNNID